MIDLIRLSLLLQSSSLLMRVLRSMRDSGLLGCQGQSGFAMSNACACAGHGGCYGADSVWGEANGVCVFKVCVFKV